MTMRSPAELRYLAEGLARKSSGSHSLPRTVEEALKILHELQVHQIELQLQNDALAEAYAESARNLEQFTSLYEYAPVAYFTLDRKGRIAKANALGRKLLVSPLCIPDGLHFAPFVTTDCLDMFRSFLDDVFARNTLESCTLTLMNPVGGDPIHVLLEGVAEEEGEACQLIVTDVTRLTLAEQRLAELTPPAGT